MQAGTCTLGGNMNIKGCYEAFGGDYDDVLARLSKEERVEKYILRFLDDQSFEQLKVALTEGNMELAFRAAHTLKGVAQNLSLTPIFEIDFELTETLRNYNSVDMDLAKAQFEKTQEAYNKVIEVIKAYKES